MNDDATVLFHSDDGPVSTASFTQALYTLGIKSGDTCLIHSDITIFGRLAAPNREQLLGGICQGLAAAVEPLGNIIMPTFTYSPCRNQVFDPDSSPSTVGVLTEYFRKLPDTVRGNHPIFSFAGKGPHAAQIVASGADSFGADSAFEHLEQADAWIVILGAIGLGMTYLHRIEQLHGCDYRFLKIFPSIVKTNGIEKSVEASFFCRHLDRDVVLDLARLEDFLTINNSLPVVKVGNGSIRAIRCRQLTALTNELLSQQPYALLAHPPSKIS